jgi:molybdenum cofactor synthesis domain-containing protein
MKNPSAAIIIIGNEVLSGRTLDINTQHIAQKLAKHGIALKEVRVIPDDRQVIIDTINTVRNKYSYVFTTGGIGPTHDDITSEAVGACFNTELELNPEAYKLLREGYEARGEGLNPAREKMAHLPKGCQLIYNSVSIAPGFILGNVYVMAGVPHIMHVMLEYILPNLPKGQAVESKAIDIMLGESLIAAEFSDLQNKYPEVDMGSYPYEIEGKHCTSLVLRSNDYVKLDLSFKELELIIQQKLKAL